MSQTATTKSFSASIVEIFSDIRTKKGNGKSFLLTRVRFTDGPLAGKVYFAQRTLGEGKASISVGQEIKAIMNIAPNAEGVNVPYFEISTSSVDSAEDIMSALGL